MVGAAAAIVFICLAAAGCSYRSDRAVAPPALPPPAAAPYEVRVGDVLEMRFFDTPTLDQTRVIGPDGRVSFLLVGELDIIGRTLANLTDELTERYAEELIEPELSLSIQEFSGLSVHVGGEVHQPGAVPYRGGLTIAQAVIDAGGFKPTARLSEVVLVRRLDDDAVASVANIEQVFKEARFSDDVLLAPTDIVYVPRARVADINKFMLDYIYNNLPSVYYFDLASRLGRP